MLSKVLVSFAEYFFRLFSRGKIMAIKRLKIRDTDWDGVKGRVQAVLLNNRWRSGWEDFAFGRLSEEIDLLFEQALNKGGIFYDIGCGSGYYSIKALGQHPKVRARGVDLSRPMISASRVAIRRKGLKSRFTVVHAPAEKTGYPKNSGTFAFASNLLHEVAEPQAVLREIHRVLKIGATIGVVDFRATKIGRAFTRHHGDSAHGPFEAEQLESYLKNCGFTRVETTIVKNRLLIIAQKQ
jgi:ubiquinone/menaquinone biosynthesis C-methylase UbiE